MKKMLMILTLAPWLCTAATVNLTNHTTLVKTPTADAHAATKLYVDTSASTNLGAFSNLVAATYLRLDGTTNMTGPLDLGGQVQTNSSSIFFNVGTGLSIVPQAAIGPWPDLLRIYGYGMGLGGGIIWNSSFDGAGSGLDADLFDGFDHVVFGMLASNQTWTGTNEFTDHIHVIDPEDDSDAASAGWVRGLFAGGEFLYASANVSSVNASNFTFVTSIPASSVRTYTNPAAGSYIGTVMSTGKYYTAYSPMTVNAYLSISSGNATVTPELYYSLDGTNYLGDYDCPAQTLSGTSPKLYSWVISFPTITETSGFYIVRRFKVATAGSSPNITFYVGTNTTSGTNSASHVAFSTPPATDLGVRGATNFVAAGASATYDTATRVLTATGLAVLAGNQTIAGTNYFSGGLNVGGTSTNAELLVTAGLTLGGVRNTAWPASGGGFVVTNLNTASADVTFTLPAPGTSFYVMAKTNAANWLYVVYGSTTSSVAGTATVKAYPDTTLTLWNVEY